MKNIKGLTNEFAAVARCVANILYWNKPDVIIPVRDMYGDITQQVWGNGQTFAGLSKAQQNIFTKVTRQMAVEGIIAKYQQTMDGRRPWVIGREEGFEDFISWMNDNPDWGTTCPNGEKLKARTTMSTWAMMNAKMKKAGVSALVYDNREGNKITPELVVNLLESDNPVTVSIQLEHFDEVNPLSQAWGNQVTIDSLTEGFDD